MSSRACALAPSPSRPAAVKSRPRPATHTLLPALPHTLLQQAVPEEPARRGHPAGGGQRQVGVPPLPRLLRGGLHHLLQLRALPQGGEWVRTRCVLPQPLQHSLAVQPAA